MRFRCLAVVLVAVTVANSDTDRPAGPRETLREAMIRSVNHKKLRQPPEPKVDPVARADSAVLVSLAWLSKHQEEDGSWSVTGHVNRCLGPEQCPESPGTDACNLGVTSLATLAFLWAGYTPLSKDVHHDICYGDIVKSGLDSIVRNLERPPPSPRREMYHALATLALCQQVHMTDMAAYRYPAKKAVLRLLGLQRSDGGWGEVGEGSDSASTCWAIMALAVAHEAELEVPVAALERARAWLGKMRDARGRVGYRLRGRDGARISGRGEAPPSLTAHAMVVEWLLDRILKSNWRASEEAKRSLELLLQFQYPLDIKSHDFFYWYSAGLAVFLYDGPGGPTWRTWCQRLKAFFELQLDDKKCTRGSYEPEDPWACLGGRVYVTAMGALMAEVYYRYPGAAFER